MSNSTGDLTSEQGGAMAAELEFGEVWVRTREKKKKGHRRSRSGWFELGSSCLDPKIVDKNWVVFVKKLKNSKKGKKKNKEKKKQFSSASGKYFF